MTGRIHLLRHGRSEAPAGLMVGQSDFPLSAEGRREGEYWRDRLAGIHFTLALASPLRRARQTAELILAGRSDNAPLRLVPELAEIFLGEWEGRPKAWVQARYPAEWEARGRDFWCCPPPGGESFRDLQARVEPAFRALAREAAGHPDTLVVAHRAVIRVILASLTGEESAPSSEMAIPTAALARLIIEADGRVDFDGHLEGPPASPRVI